jgi:hypothetical protein
VIILVYFLVAVRTTSMLIQSWTMGIFISSYVGGTFPTVSAYMFAWLWKWI